MYRNDAANCRMQVVPDLALVGKLQIAGTTPSATQTKRTALCTSNNSGSNTATLTFSGGHDFRAGELIQPPTNAAPVLLLCPLRVVSITATTVNVILPRAQVLAANDANGVWTAVTVGDDTGGTGDLMSGDDLGAWLKSSNSGATGGLKVWREDNPTLLALFPEQPEFVWLCRTNGATPETLYFSANVDGRMAYAGKYRAIGMSVVPLSPDMTLKPVINVGTTAGSTYGAAAANSVGDRSFINFVRKVGAAPDQYFDGVEVTGPAGSYFAVAGFVRRYASTISDVVVDGEYVPHIGFVRPQSSITFDTLNGASLTFPEGPDATGPYHSYRIDSYQESYGRIGPGVSRLHWNLEATGDVPGTIIATREKPGAPVTYGHVVTALGRVTDCSIQSDADGTNVTATVTVPEGHGLFDGQRVTVFGAQQAGFSGDHIITRIDNQKFTYQFPDTDNPFPSNPGTVTSATRLTVLLRYVAAGRCELNLSVSDPAVNPSNPAFDADGSFYIYSPQPGSRFDFISMDTNLCWA